MISIYMVFSDFNRITTADWLMPFDLFISQTTANVINFAYWVIFPAFVVIADLNFFQNILSGTLSPSQTVWIQISTNILTVLIWVQTVCKGLITVTNKANSTNLYPPTKGYLRETCKSQNINSIYLTLSSPTVSFRS